MRPTSCKISPHGAIVVDFIAQDALLENAQLLHHRQSLYGTDP
jgi:hypothetical protein